MAAKPRVLPNKQQLKRARDEGWESWIASKQDEIAVAQGCYFDISAATGTKNFFEKLLTHTKAPFDGKPFLLLPWQWTGLIGPLYGWRMSDGTRRYSSSFVFIPKKNGKTQLAAGIALRELYEQAGARIFMTAVSQSQAADCFEESANMVERQPLLNSRLDVRRSTYRILDPSRSASIAAITASEGSSQGKNASCLILDELHEWKNRAFFGSILYATAARINSLVFMITTAGDTLNSICYEEYERAHRILAGKDLSIDHLPLIFEADKDADFEDLEQWKKANPSYGITLPERNIKKAIEEAKGSPQRIGDLRRYRLNLWTQPRDSWLDVATWDALPKIAPADFEGKQCFAGLDLARVRDFAAFVRLFNYEGGVAILVRLWIPKDRIVEKQKSDKIPLAEWVRHGFVHATPGDEIDFNIIRKQIVDDHAVTPITELGFDPALAAAMCNQQLAAEDGLSVVAVPPGAQYMSPPATEFERLINAGKIHHEGNPCLSWMIGNVIVYRDSNDNIVPRKGRSKGRIDGVSASIIALSRHLSGSNGNRRTYYDDDREPEFI